jgi:cobaltochelatase CobN
MHELSGEVVATDRGAVLAQVLICDGCCCGRADRGFPPVPRDWLKSQWKARKLNRHVQLTISGCLGPCDVANVVAILTPQGCTWLGKLSREDQYAELFAWACAAADLGVLQPLPPVLRRHVFRRFDAAAPAVPCGSGDSSG